MDCIKNSKKKLQKLHLTTKFNKRSFNWILKHYILLVISVSASENNFTENEGNIFKFILQFNIGYTELKNVCVKIGCVLVFTASTERSFN